jgi:hypothetical protein
MLNHVGTQIIAYLIRRPGRTPEQMLHPIGRLIPRVLCELPAVFAVERTQEPLYVGGRTLARLGTENTRPHPSGHRWQPVGPPVGCVHRGLVCVHFLLPPLLLSPWTGEHHASAIYNCSTRQSDACDWNSAATKAKSAETIDGIIRDLITIGHGRRGSTWVQGEDMSGKSQGCACLPVFGTYTGCAGFSGRS